ASPRSPLFPYTTLFRSRTVRVALESQDLEGQKTTVKHLGAAVALTVLASVLFPGVAHAWTPGTHIFLGESVLANLHQLPTIVARSEEHTSELQSPDHLV